MDSTAARLGRRTFVATSLATGFALAVRPVGAQTITTDATGLVAGEIKIGDMPAYRAMPEGNGKLPLMLVVPEIFGVHEHIKDVTRRFAKAGYMAIAPDVFARQGDPTKMADIGEIVSKVISKTPDEQVMKDLDATVDYAKKSGKLDGDRVGITGFCWGGRIVWLYSAHNGPGGAPKAGAAWYGQISNATNALQTKTALDQGAKAHAPVIGFYGGRDTHIPQGQIELMRKELAANPKKLASEIIVYPDAEHGFNADYRPSYNKADATDAWQKLLAFMKKSGV
ncbi:MAG: Carboxymethylenebutenolidase [Myxococcaceae bacterium]|jgi:carboxymethylenebutenolidase|nr:Carboxymethylenebutenolidase [Myxococcaceae bacterium]MEA2748461.1 carboxymethylenebutenolidase [Myxococcales bacterium]